ncbi:hypothetical protein COOONC_13659 [Cooperia oncophora]
MANEIKLLKEENSALRKCLEDSRLSSSHRQNSSQVSSLVERSHLKVDSELSFEEAERRRSIVIIGVQRCRDTVEHDTLCVRQLLNYLSIDCAPIATYRMGRPSMRYNRLLKANSARASRFIELCTGLNFHQLVSKPTHGPNILDLILTNNSQLISNTMIQTPIGNSDHASVAFSINLEAEQNSEIMSIRDFDWYGSFQSVDILNEKCEFLSVIHHTIELFVPLKPQKTTGVQLPLHLIRCNRKKNSAWAKAVSSDNQADWDEYNKLRTTFEKRVRCRTIVSGDGGFLWFDKEEIYKLLIRWPRSRSDTPDHVPLVFIKKVAHIVYGPLAFLLFYES